MKCADNLKLTITYFPNMCHIIGNVTAEGSGCNNEAGSVDIPTVAALATTGCMMTIVILANILILWALVARGRKASKLNCR